MAFPVNVPPADGLLWRSRRLGSHLIELDSLKHKNHPPHAGYVVGTAAQVRRRSAIDRVEIGTISLIGIERYTAVGTIHDNYLPLERERGHRSEGCP